MLSYHPEPLMHPEEQSVVEGEVRERVEHREVEDLRGDEGQRGEHNYAPLVHTAPELHRDLPLRVLVAVEDTHRLVYRGVNMMMRRRRRRMEMMMMLRDDVKRNKNDCDDDSDDDDDDNDDKDKEKTSY